MSWKDRAKPVSETKTWKDRAKPVENYNMKEAHPDFSGMLGTFNRWGVKNLGGYNAEDFEKSIHAKWPNKYETKVRDGAVFIKDGDTYKALDPQTGALSTDIIGDTGDIVSDMIKAPIDATGASLGALGGFVSPVPGGAILGAMGGGATTSAATETARQGLGNLFGFREGYDKSNIALESALGGIMPGIAGAGKASLPVFKNQVKNIAPKAMRGVPSLLRDHWKATVYPSLSGLNKRARSTIRHYADDIKTMDPEKHLIRFIDLIEDAKNKVTSHRKSVGAQYGKALEKTDFSTDIKKIKKPIVDELLTRRRLAQTGNPSAIKKYRNARGEYYNTFKGAGKFKGKDVLRFKDDLDNSAKAYKIGKKTFSSRFKDSDGIADKELANSYTNSAIELKNQIDSGAEAFPSLRKMYKNSIDDAKFLDTKLKNPEAAERTLRNFASQKNINRNQMLINLDKKYNLGLQKEADIMDVFQLLNNDGVLTPKGSGLAEGVGYFTGAQSNIGAGAARTGGRLVKAGWQKIFNPKKAKDKIINYVEAQQKDPTIDRNIWSELLKVPLRNISDN